MKNSNDLLSFRRCAGDSQTHKRKQHRRASNFILIMLIILGWLPVGTIAHAAKIRLSQSNVGITSAPLWVATSHGLFKKYGIDLEPVYVRNSTIQMMALTTGEVQLSHTGGAPTPVYRTAVSVIHKGARQRR
jgi:ABC-type nitrate/sulfonate/bicarbonate transport system substrate-binding protein